MTFLQLGQRLTSEAGASGTGMATMTSQVGEYGRMVNWINDSWLDIQRLHQDWDWQRTSATTPTVSGQANYPLSAFTDANGNLGLTDMGTWELTSARNYATQDGIISEIYMDYLGYNEWRDMYLYGALRFTQSRPNVFSVLPADHSIVLGPVPITGYVFEIDYFREPYKLVNDTDVPTLPPQWHMAIVYKAMMRYGKYEENEQIVADNKEEYQKLIREMQADWLPDVVMGPTLA